MPLQNRKPLQHGLLTQIQSYIVPLTGFKIVLAECPQLMENYLKAFDPEATTEKYAEKLRTDVNSPMAGSEFSKNRAKLNQLKLYNKKTLNFFLNKRNIGCPKFPGTR